MQELSPQQLRRLKKLAEVLDKGNLAVLDHLFEIEEKLDSQMPDLNKVLESVRGQKGEVGAKGDKGDKGDRGEKGDNGKDGRDGREGKDGKDGRNGIDGVDGEDGKDGKDGEMGIIDTATIAYLEEQINSAKNEIAGVRQGRAGWGAHPLVVKDGNTVIDKVTRVINFANNLSATRSADGVVTVNATAGGGGVTVETPVGSVNASNATFTVSDVPQWVVADGITYFDGAGYSYGALSITMDVAPSQYIRVII